ncbi:unnamed protein product [Acanthoscelides obtectus]|uniref:Uncharacterized protein n=1 Tax=Acanthoscelides obtectus TaxID=200917 RepID=A0A9P0M0J0_ACAOB|nr:unnamed protein product [Acanthoscelides obtectus]CAK1650705.1 hypothetical protein AOBTE_LOCUS16874 [Acanthoscelides obtectus]
MPKRQSGGSGDSGPRRKRGRKYDRISTAALALLMMTKVISSTTPEAYIGCREIIRKSMIKRGVPEEVIPIVTASISKGTLNQYDICYRKWWEFCVNLNSDPLTPNLKNNLFFFKEQMNNELSYSSLNIYRSALNLIIEQSLHDDRIIERFLKGVYNLRPPMPKYQSTWDPEPVLSYLKTLYPLDSLTIELLTKKLVMLLELASGEREHTLSKISLNKISKVKDRIEIKISEELWKKQTSTCFDTSLP